MSKRALVTGVNGQDGSYLAGLLLAKGYEVHGTIRRASLPNLQRLDGITDKLHLHHCDLSDSAALNAAVRESAPDEVYNLGAMSDVAVSFVTPEYAGNVTGLGVIRILEAVRQNAPDARFYQAGSSEMFGMNPNVPCNEESAFYPASPYAAAKVYAYHVTKNYREAYGMFACNGILFNHESERRGVEFVTRKITLGLADILDGRADKLRLGALGTSRDWGHARDYVQAMWMMLQAETPDDYVVATGETHTVLEFVEKAFALVGLDWHDFVVINPEFIRPVDPPVLLGDSKKINDQLGWAPTMSFDDLVRAMVIGDCGEKSLAWAARKEHVLVEHYR
jgi:GDPmannose 4,6-dehydratase